MKTIKRTESSLHGEGGFSLAEVMVAGLILALAVFPMVGMFDGAFLVSKTAYDINISAECLELYTETVKSMPFYVAHAEGDESAILDMDDAFWGTRTPVNTNSWSTAPEVLIKDFDIEPYADMKVTVKMAFIDDEIVSGMSLEAGAEATTLSEDWDPTALYGYDRPKTADGKPLTLILYEVKVTTENGRQYTNAQLYASPTDVVANVYIDRVVNVSADTTKLGTRDNDYGDNISAPHNKNSITIRAYGEGFTQSDVDSGIVDVKLVRVEDADIQLNNMTYGEDGSEAYLEGTIDLSDGGGDEEPWGPEYRMPGYWHTWLVVNHVISVRNNAFIVEYPVPVYHSPGSDFTDSDGNRSGMESTADETITFTGIDYTMSFVTGEYPNPGIGAVMQLVHTVEDNGVPIDSINGTDLTINPSLVDGYQAGLTVSAHFDFTGKIGGDYKIRIVNCIDRATPSAEVMGNTYFELDAGPYYYLEGPPAVNEVYVYEATPVTASPRHFAYDDRGYSYTLEIKGFNFDNLISASDIILGLGGDPNTDPPTGDNEITGTALGAVNVLDTETIQLTVDFGPEVAETERGLYWLYVRNSNGFGTVLNPAFDVRAPAPIIYDYEVDSYGLWQNYYNVGMTIIGECFDVDAVAGTYVDVMLKEKLVPANDLLATEAMSDPVAGPDGRLLACEVNLVDCDLGEWELYVKSQPAGLTDSGYADAISGVLYQTFLRITAGAPMLLTDAVPIAGEPASVSVASRYRCWNTGTSDWKDWRAWQASTESDGTPAWAYEDDENRTDPKTGNSTQGVMYFTKLSGMGFNEGTITVNAVNDHGEGTAGMNATWPAATVKQDRATAAVWIEMVEGDELITGPHVKDDGSTLNPIRLRIMNNMNSVWSAWYNDRIRIEIGSSY